MTSVAALVLALGGDAARRAGLRRRDRRGPRQARRPGAAGRDAVGRAAGRDPERARLERQRRRTSAAQIELILGEEATATGRLGRRPAAELGRRRARPARDRRRPGRQPDAVAARADRERDVGRRPGRREEDAGRGDHRRRGDRDRPARRRAASGLGRRPTSPSSGSTPRASTSLTPRPARADRERRRVERDRRREAGADRPDHAAVGPASTAGPPGWPSGDALGRAGHPVQFRHRRRRRAGARARARRGSCARRRCRRCIASSEAA